MTAPDEAELTPADHLREAAKLLDPGVACDCADDLVCEHGQAGRQQAQAEALIALAGFAEQIVFHLAEIRAERYGRRS
jgi:hypothetical protein